MPRGQRWSATARPVPVTNSLPTHALGCIRAEIAPCEGLGKRDGRGAPSYLPAEPSAPGEGGVRRRRLRPLQPGITHAFQIVKCREPLALSRLGIPDVGAVIS